MNGKAVAKSDKCCRQWHWANWAILTKKVLRAHFARQACA